MVNYKPTDIDKRNEPNPLHRCFYTIQKRSIVHEFEGRKLVRRQFEERCKCSRFKSIDHKFDPLGVKSPTRTIRWYDAEGNLERVTGDK